MLLAPTDKVVVLHDDLFIFHRNAGPEVFKECLSCLALAFLILLCPGLYHSGLNELILHDYSARSMPFGCLSPCTLFE
jgi:hypothetical protein